ncbi:MAG: hypothetical protein QOK31_149 [Solirubrobacteraceae bacterium]|jgi:Tfp pilus assembly protein PilV|nr:hypothetical protein [Solirubrobacteraceae bacterium]
MAVTSWRAERGFTLIEVLIASVLLIVGVLGTFALVEMANAGATRAQAGQGATNLAREVLEDAGGSPYAAIGQANWLTTNLAGLSGGSGAVSAPAANSLQTTVSRRGIAYTLTLSWCSVDDTKDSYGAHASGTAWCADSQTTGSGDSQPADFKRVAADVSYATRGTARPTVQQVATFASGGSAVGPTSTSLQITAPTGLSQTAPVITGNPAGGNAVFVATAPGSADVRFSVNGAEASSGVVNNNNGTWTFSWPIGSLTDGTYAIAATAIDALGVRGQPRTLPVKLARGAPVAPANVRGGYNNVWVAGAKTQAVELQWDANPEGAVTGYEVLRGGTSVCGGSTNLAITCIDLAAPSTGSTTYTVRTWYRDSAGSTQSVSQALAVTAPIASTLVATLYGFTNGTANSSAKCSASSPQQDLASTFPTSGGTQTAVTGALVVGCMPPLPAGSALSAGTVTFSAWFTNTGTKTCNSGDGYALYLNGGGTPLAKATLNIPPGIATPTMFTVSDSVVARTFAAGDQLTWIQAVRPNSACSGTTFYYGSGATQSTLSIPTLTGGAAGTPIPVPSPPGSLTGAHDSTANTNTLTWTAPATSSPAVDFYRIYRDGTDYTARIDTTDATASTLSIATAVNTTTATVADSTGFAAGQSVSVDTGASQDNLTIASVSGKTITFVTAASHAHAVSAPLSLRSITWTDTHTGGASHTYYVTAASAAMSESTPFLGPTASL